MSVSIYVQGGKSIKEEYKCHCSNECRCDECKAFWEYMRSTEDDFHVRDGKRIRNWDYICPNCPWCKGTGKKSFDTPEAELNLSSQHFREFAKIINIFNLDPEELAGEIKGRMLDATIRQATFSLNVRKNIERETYPDEEYKGEGGCTVFECGTTAEYWQDVLERYLAIATKAKQQDTYLYYM